MNLVLQICGNWFIFWYIIAMLSIAVFCTLLPCSIMSCCPAMLSARSLHLVSWRFVAFIAKMCSLSYHLWTLNDVGLNPHPLLCVKLFILFWGYFCYFIHFLFNNFRVKNLPSTQLNPIPQPLFCAPLSLRRWTLLFQHSITLQPIIVIFQRLKILYRSVGLCVVLPCPSSQACPPLLCATHRFPC